MGVVDSQRARVREALHALCAEARQKDSAVGILGLFGHSFTAQAVAERAGVSVSTARKWLDDLCRWRGYQVRNFKGAKGYSYRGDQ